MIVPVWLWITLGISSSLFILTIILNRREKKKLLKILEKIDDGIICRVCGHKHYSWFDEKDGPVCDWCRAGINCPDEEEKF